ncbi:MAG: DUF2933 domain-containing protein [Lachnospiraceae bacterium]|nr:DUF2933 domain-containing protein [Lachnospiraceae bacterium]
MRRTRQYVFSEHKSALFAPDVFLLLLFCTISHILKKKQRGHGYGTSNLQRSHG